MNKIVKSFENEIDKKIEKLIMLLVGRFAVNGTTEWSSNFKINTAIQLIVLFVD